MSRVGALREEIGQLESKLQEALKKLEDAEARCQETTREIWQIDMQLGREEDRANEAEERVRELEARLAELEAGTGGGADPALLAELEERHQKAQERCQELEAKLAELGALSDSLIAAQAELELAEQRSEQLQTRLSELEAAHQNLQSELEAAAGRDSAGDSKLEELRELLAEAEARARKAEDRALGAEQQVREAEEVSAQVASSLDEAETRAEEAEAALKGSRALIRDLESQLRVFEENALSVAEAGAAGPELQARLTKAEELAALNLERAELLQARYKAAVEKAEMAEERAALAEQRSQEAQARCEAAEGQLRASQSEFSTLQARLERAEQRVGDADKVYAAAEERVREAEQQNKDSWQRVRESELRANQALIELKKVTEKLEEYEKKTQESDRETQRLAFQDLLTGLPNLNLVNQYLDFTVKQCLRYKRVAALLVIDIDRFKVFNEAMGFKAGDELLIKIADRLRETVRETDSLGRRGEDEFLVLLSELNPGDPNSSADLRRVTIQNHVELVARRVMEHLAAPFTVQNQKYYIQASIGIAICPDDGDSAESLLENADTAMYHVKETGRNRYQFYTVDLRRRQEQRLTLDTQMRHALERREFQLLYQPVINMVGKGKGSMVGVEALLRWNHRVDGLVGPDFFLPAAEESGMIIPIGQWVMRETCAQLREWLGMGLRIFASVNLSKRQLLQADLAESTLAIVAEQRIPPEALYLEIAEGLSTLNPDLMDKVISDLGNAGVRIAIDDFGVGFSSLSRLNPQFTKILKIDMSIIHALPNDKNACTICVAAINLARSLGLLSLAEGVENAAQVKFLAKAECALAQGFFFSEPVMTNHIMEFHRSKKVWKF